MSYQDIVPYTCVYLANMTQTKFEFQQRCFFQDASWQDFFKAARQCTLSCVDRGRLIQCLQHMWTSNQNPNPVLPCLSVRSALDLYLSVMKFPRGSEVIMSAINIPDMVRVLEHHGLQAVPLDVSLETLAPKLELLDSLVTDKTVALLVAHLYGKQFCMERVIQAAHGYGIKVIEDLAEAFNGFTMIGHPQSDIALFSFGTIKLYTAFGGAIAKVKDAEVFQKMQELHDSYPTQPQSEYLKKVMQYSIIYLFLNCPNVVRPAMMFCRSVGLDHKNLVVRMLRGFPSKLMEKIRHQPSKALLYMMYERMAHFDPMELNLIKVKAEYLSERLPEGVTQVGNKSPIKNYWLFPIVVENPEEVVKALVVLGVDAYRGATQLNVVEPSERNGHLDHLQTFITRYPYEAKFLIDHIVYLPVNKLVPFHELDRICRAVHTALRNSSGSRLLPVKPTSKL